MDKYIDADFIAGLIKKLTSSTKYYGVVNIQGSRQGVTRFANSEISQNVNQSDLSVSLTLHDGKKEATCRTNVLDDEGLKQLARDTESLLAVTPEGEYDHMPWKRLELPLIENDKNLTAIYGAKGRAEAIKEGIESLGSPTADFTAAGALILEKKIAAYGNSESSGILFAELDNVQFNTVVTNTTTGADGGGECLSHKTGELDIAKAFLEAKHKSVLGANSITLDGGEYTVILSPQAVGDLVFYLTWSLNAKRIIDGLSFCDGTSETIGKTRIFGENINIYDDVNDPSVFPWYFDYEGYKRQPLPLIEKGVVKNVLHDSKTSRLISPVNHIAGNITANISGHMTEESGKLTGHAYSNKGLGGFSLHTVMAGGDVSQEEMIKNTKRGLLISELHYTNFVNPRALQLTGLTRNGTFLIEDGEIARAVSTMRFTQSLLEAFKNIEALSKEQTVVNNGGWAAVMPAAKIGRFCFP